MKIIQCYFSAAILLFIFFSCNGQPKMVLSAEEFEKALVNNHSSQILDVRTAEEYNGGHIKNALLADWKDEEEFNRRISFIDKNKPVFVYCLGGGRSAAAAVKMKENGFQQVYELKGGMNAWKAENNLVEGKSNQKEMSMLEFNNAIKTASWVLVDFGAEWCPPCKKMEPILESLQKNSGNKLSIVKVDGGKDEAILKTYNVTSLPVFILFKDGKQVWRKEGIVEEKEIAALLL
jgi:thioredoxin